VQDPQLQRPGSGIEKYGTKVQDDMNMKEQECERAREKKVTIN